MSSNAKYSPIVVTTALANVTNLPLVLDFLILILWFELSYLFLASHLIRFWLNFSALSSHFVQSLAKSASPPFA
jgi:hypothetical protein